MGFVAAALSSMLTATLGIGIVTDGVFSIKNKECKDDKIDNETVEMDERKQYEQHIPSSDSRAAILNEEASENYCENLPADRPFPVKYKNAAMIFSVVVGAAVIAANAPSIKVILIAQVTFSFNALTIKILNSNICKRYGLYHFVTVIDTSTKQIKLNFKNQIPKYKYLAFMFVNYM